MLPLQSAKIAIAKKFGAALFFAEKDPFFALQPFYFLLGSAALKRRLFRAYLFYLGTGNTLTY